MQKKNAFHISLLTCLASLILLSGGYSYFNTPQETNSSNNQSHTIYESQKEKSVFGAASINNKTYKRLHVNGSVEATHIKVCKDVIINGSISANDINVDGSLTINGLGTLDHANIAERTQIRGALTATNSNFSAIAANTTEIYFKNSSIDSIVIHKPTPTDNNTTQTVILDNSTVHNNIIFEKDGGKVIIRNNATIQGNVIGGIEQKN